MEEFITETFFVSLLCGIIFLIMAAIMHYFPPKEINHLYGYRTPASMKTQERWDFAQRFSTRQMVRGALVTIILSVLGYFIPIAVGIKISIGFVLIVLLAVYLFISTERAIKEQFNDMP